MKALEVGRRTLVNKHHEDQRTQGTHKECHDCKPSRRWLFARTQMGKATQGKRPAIREKAAERLILTQEDLQGSSAQVGESIARLPIMNSPKRAFYRRVE